MAVKRKSGLGKGLNELFQNTSVIEDEPQAEETASDKAVSSMPDGSWLSEIPVAAIQPNPRQPRQVFDEDDIDELSASIREVGVLQPVVVRPEGDGYILVMGERRLRATKRAGLETIPAVVRETADVDMLRDALLENLHRVQLNPLEEANAYEQLLDDFGCTQDELARRIKRSRPHIANTLRLLTLPAPVQRRVAAGVLSAGHARALLGLTDPVAQEHLAQRIVAEGLSVRATEEQVTLSLRDMPVRPMRRRGRATLPPEVEKYAYSLSNRLDTSVKIALGAKKGRLTIEFADQDDLDRIMSILRPRSE